MRARALVGGALLGSLSLGAVGCADLSATANVPSDVTLSTQAPGALEANATVVLQHLPPDTATVEHGVVLAETTNENDLWFARVLIRGGVAVLSEGSSCDEWEDTNWWDQQVVPGDAIEWSPKGNAVCPGQVSVTQVGAALVPTPTSTRG